ncbi:MAG: hypothetical protein K8L99_02570, partial [Anaerolineae bacterium]|nr:hypothetical protein [Anaerolineae bacterium]
MDNEMRREIRQLLPALKSLASSTDRAITMQTYGAMGNMAVKSYRNLHGRLVQLLPDDGYVTDALALEVNESSKDEDKVAQVNLAANQLVEYLEAQVRTAPPPPPRPGFAPHPPDAPDAPE